MEVSYGLEMVIKEYTYGFTEEDNNCCHEHPGSLVRRSLFTFKKTDHEMYIHRLRKTKNTKKETPDSSTQNRRNKGIYTASGKAV